LISTFNSDDTIDIEKQINRIHCLGIDISDSEQCKMLLPERVRALFQLALNTLGFKVMRGLIDGFNHNFRSRPIIIVCDDKWVKLNFSNAEEGRNCRLYGIGLVIFADQQEDDLSWVNCTKICE